MKTALGFTLVEIMIAITLVAILAMVGAPLTNSWSTSADMVTAKGVLRQAITRAKTVAVRNEFGLTENKSAAAICIASDKKIEVRRANNSNNSASCNTNGGTVVWKASISQTLAVKRGTTAFSCACFDNKGQILTSAVAACSACGANTNLTLSATGVDDEAVNIY